MVVETEAELGLSVFLSVTPPILFHFTSSTIYPEPEMASLSDLNRYAVKPPRTSNLCPFFFKA